MEPGKTRRGYDNSRRAEQARATRRRVVDAARTLLVARGYGATTLAQVATAAGVSVETVQKAFGTKAGLAKAVYDETLVGDDEPVPLRDRAAMTALFADPDPHRKLVRYAGIGRGLWERLGDLVPVIMAGAAAGDPDLVELVATIRRESRDGARVIVRHLAAEGALRSGLDEEQATDELWLLLQPENLGLLVGERGWSLDRFQEWFARSAARVLLEADRV
ncbi:MAG TPA: TetR/AcrR family transcriptional regulator [Actinomycetospora sp.]|nr:TetR/AcrR family transcriptional regulator [Actinomycetospora sp.]